MRIATIPMLTLTALSASCARAPSPPPPVPAAQAKPAERQKTVIDAQLKAIDKAKAVQGMMDERTKMLDEQMKAGENPPEQRDKSE